MVNGPIMGSVMFIVSHTHVVMFNMFRVMSHVSMFRGHGHES